MGLLDKLFGDGAGKSAVPAVEEESGRPRSRAFHAKVVGVSHKNPDGSSRQKIIGRCRVGERLFLIPEPANPYDPEAVKVCRQNGEQVGYLEAIRTAGEISRLIGRGGRAEAEIADIMGGGAGKHLGIVIRITKFDPDDTG